MARFSDISDKNKSLTEAASAFEKEDQNMGMLGMGYY
jgi:hypothetical protein